MPGRLSWDIRNDGPPRELILAGDIDEDSDFASLLTALGDDCVLSLEKIARINSTGVRAWLQFMKEARAGGHKLTLRDCSVVIVNQLNIISDFAQGAEVVSVFAPYVCPECDAVTQRLITMAEDPREQVASGIPCPECGDEMEFDDFPEHYFSFAK